jgi:phosphoglycolate phosphatase
VRGDGAGNVLPGPSGTHPRLKYAVAIFDSDGTLADTLPWMHAVFNDVAELHGLKRVTPEDYERVRDLHGRELLRALNLPLWKLPRLVRDMRGRMTAQAGKFTLFPGIREALERLVAAGIRLAIVSSNSRANVENVLGPEGARLIDCYDCGASMFGKASKLRRVVRKCGGKHAIYIGDEVRDAEAAREVGIAFGAVGWGHHRMEVLRGLNPEESFSAPAEIAERLCCGA